MADPSTRPRTSSTTSTCRDSVSSRSDPPAPSRSSSSSEPCFSPGCSSASSRGMSIMASIQVSQTKSRRWGSATWLAHGLVMLLCLLTVFPFVWMLSTSLKIPTEIFTKGITIIPRTLTFQNYPDAFDYFPVAHWFWNSFFIAAATTLGKLVISVPAAFAFARLKFRGSGLLFALVLGTLIVPTIVTYVPNYVTIARWNWINTPQGVIVPSIAHSAFIIFLLRQYIRTIPEEILDAARLDGASTWRLLTNMIVPNIRSAIAVVTILSFLSAW